MTTMGINMYFYYIPDIDIYKPSIEKIPMEEGYWYMISTKPHFNSYEFIIAKYTEDGWIKMNNLVDTNHIKFVSQPFNSRKEAKIALNYLIEQEGKL